MQQTNFKQIVAEQQQSLQQLNEDVIRLKKEMCDQASESLKMQTLIMDAIVRLLNDKK